MQKIALLTLFLFSLLTLSAQREEYFSSTPKDMIGIPAAHSIEFGVLPYREGFPSVNSYNLFNMSLYLGYRYQMAVSNRWSIDFTAGVHNTIGIAHDTGYDDRGYQSPNGGYRTTYTPCIELGIEPRWYFSYQSLHSKGKAPATTGWFLALPLSAAYSYRINYSYTTDQLNGYLGTFHLSLLPSIGYRYAISRQLYIEAVAGVGASLLQPVSDQYYTPTIELAYSFAFKIGYAF